MVSSSGAGETVYGYTGEMQSGGLVHLRARDYASQLGRFTSRDTWEGDVNSPLSLNEWLYVEGNPVKFIDPSGLIKQGQEDIEASGIVNRLSIMNIRIEKDWGFLEYSTNQFGRIINGCGWLEGSWKILELQLIEEAATRLNQKLNGKITSVAGKVDVEKVFLHLITKERWLRLFRLII